MCPQPLYLVSGRHTSHEAFAPRLGMASSSYAVNEVMVAPRPVAGVRAQVPRGRVAHEFGHYLDQVYAAERTGAVVLDGQNIFVYRASTGDLLTIDFCVGITASFAALGAVVPMETPHGVAATTTHYGGYGGLGNASAAILAWCRVNNRRRAGPSWEVYGHWYGDPAPMRIDVYFLLQSTDARSGS